MKINGREILSQTDLKYVLHYEPDTGIFTWKNTMKGLATRGSVAGNMDKTRGYIRIRIHGLRYAAHRLAWLYMTGEWPKDQLDHINGIRNDNRFINLREVDNQKNQFNSKPRNSTGYKGVYRSRDRFKSSIRAGKIIKHLGVFDRPEDAHNAYVKASFMMHGKYGRVS